MGKRRTFQLVLAIGVAIIARCEQGVAEVATASDAAVSSGVAQDLNASSTASREGELAGRQDDPKDVLNLDIDELARTPIRPNGGPSAVSLTSPSSSVSGAPADSGAASTTADLLKQAPSVSARRVSAITMDPRIRGYHSSQLNATANGMNQLKARLDIDTLYSQIDPGIVQNITVIDGPYTSLYGPGFAFMAADLLPTPRFDTPQAHLSTNFVYGSNAQSIYSRDNVLAGGTNWGACVSYGLRDGNDYRTGGSNSYLVPSRYQKWDTMAAVSLDVNRYTRVEVNYLRTEMNGVELPGVIYDIENSINNQYNLSYIIQEDRNGPKQLVLQTWYTNTSYCGDSSNSSKQWSFYRPYISEGEIDPNFIYTAGDGDLETMGVRCLRTFGAADSPQLTVGADWRRYSQRYTERSLTTEGPSDVLYGVPRSLMDDGGVLTDLLLPMDDTLSFNIGGRVDACRATIDQSDPVAAQTDIYTPRYDEPSYTLGMAYLTSKKMLTERTALKGGIAFAMRSPDLSELYNYQAYVPAYRFGNTYNDGLSTLKPEKDLQLDLGLAYETKKVRYGVRGFCAMIQDYILASPCWIDPAQQSQYATYGLGRNFSYFPASQRSDLETGTVNADQSHANYVYGNISSATLLGGDLFGEYELHEGVSVFGNMSYVYGVNNSPVSVETQSPYYSTDVTLVPIDGTDGLPGIYPLSGNVGIRFFEPVDDRWSIEFSCRMVHRQDHVAVTLSEVPAPGYVTFALGGYYRLRKNIRLSLNIENLLNRAYQEPGSLAIMRSNGTTTFVEEPGITVLTGVDARF